MILLDLFKIACLKSMSEVSSPLKKRRKFVITTIKHDTRLIRSDAVGPSGESLRNVEHKYIKYMNPIGPNLKRAWPPTSDDDNM